MAQLLHVSFGSAPTFAPRSTSPARQSRASRKLLAGTVAAGALGVGMWLAVHHVPWFGPWLADGLRATVGSERVTWLEEMVAGAEDKVHQVTKQGEVRGLAEAVPTASALPLPVAAVGETLHRPSDVGPVNDDVRAEGDGQWQAVAVRKAASPVLYRTLLHPDAARTYAELFVFALDLGKVNVHAVAGSIEPRRPDGANAKQKRPGTIPDADRGVLVAAFNGGFKAEHGQYGMMTGGMEWLAPKKTSCTFAAGEDGQLRIAPWSTLATDASSLTWWRQTPSCMVENGALHAGLRSEKAKGWGATLEGDTVIRRSAVGLSEDGRILYVGISNFTTAPALARGMAHAGATNVAQLDVNFSYPRFLLYRDAAEAEGGLLAEGAIKGLLYEENEYVARKSSRDFFYVTLNQ